MRYAEYKDIPYLKQLWEEAFTEENGFMESFFNERASAELNNILLLENETDKRIVSMLYLLPCKMLTSDGQVISAVNIVGVATSLKERKKGYMSKLINECFEVLKERNIDIAFLKPSSTAFYEQYGFRVSNILYKTKINRREYEFYDEITPELIENLNYIYTSSISSGSKILRSYEDWAFNLRGMTAAIKDGSYAICTLKNDEYISHEIVPIIKGTVSGCCMYKIIGTKNILMEFNEENFIFEQY